MFSRLLKKVAIPRTKKKEMVITIRMVFEAIDDNDDDAKRDCRYFKQWIQNVFSQWSDTILQHFLYSHKLIQDFEDKHYRLTMQIEDILKDESSTLSDELQQNKEIEDTPEEIEDKRRLQKWHDEHHDELEKKREELKEKNIKEEV